MRFEDLAIIDPILKALKDKNYSAYHDMAKLINSKFVYKCVLQDNHRHASIDELLELLNGYH